MARVVVVGGGFGGLASAVRLAKLGHEVTLLERSRDPGRCARPRSPTASRWDAGPTSTLLPAVVRDLFRKSGRPLERELDLEPLDLVREHRFEDGTSLRLPPGRAPRRSRRSTRSEPGSGRRWVDHVASYADVWEVLRRGYLEMPWQPDDLPRDVAGPLDSRETLHSGCAKTFKDERLRQVAGHPFVAEGHDLRNVPAWAGLVAYLEQRFGAWTVAGGMAPLADVLAARLATRGVDGADRHRGPRPRGPRRAGSSAVATDAGEVDADVVVCAIDPRRLPALARLRRAHHARDPAGGLPRRARRRRPRPAARGGRCTATRCWSCAPAAALPTGRGLDRARPRQARRGHPHARWPGTSIDVRAHVVVARRPLPRATWSSAGAARRSACCGRAARPCATGSARGPRSRGCTPPARTPRPAPACRSSGSPPRWSPPRSARPEPQTADVEGGEDLERRLGAVERVEVQARARRRRAAPRTARRRSRCPRRASRPGRRRGRRSGRRPRRAPRCRSARPGGGSR